LGGFLKHDSFGDVGDLWDCPTTDQSLGKQRGRTGNRWDNYRLKVPIDLPTSTPQPAHNLPTQHSDCLVFVNEERSIIMKEGEEPSESSPKRQRREDPETQSDDNNKNKASSSSASHPEVQLQTPKVFIGGLHRNVTETHVEKLMMPYGSIVKVNLVLQPGSSTSKGFAFCQYETLEQAASAVSALDGRALLGRRLLVRPAFEQQRPTAPGIGMAAGGGGTNKANSTGVSREKEQRNLETKIQAIKRKIAATKQVPAA
jgi:RNA recognition motif-containing protein